MFEELATDLNYHSREKMKEFREFLKVSLIEARKRYSTKLDLECMECGWKFKSSSLDPKCPKCGSYDVDVE